jgi:hypothetical protein
MNVITKVGGNTSIIQVTEHDLFWHVTRHAWTEAVELTAGDQLRTDDDVVTGVAGQGRRTRVRRISQPRSAVASVAIFKAAAPELAELPADVLLTVGTGIGSGAQVVSAR